jgi:hypothetical protein
MDYITIAQVDALLGAGWAGTGDPARAVLMANAWLTAKRLPTFDVVPDVVVQAGAEVAREAAAGRLYQAAETGVLSKSVQAGSASSAKTYARNAKKLTAGEVFANALLSPYQRGSVMMLKRL